MPGEIARIVVDRRLCISAGICVTAAPGVFQLDDENIAIVIDPEGGDEDSVYEAAEGCPTAAISLYNADGKRLFP